jgi:branched-chain amino acid transport system substrate-binding protein
MTIDSTPGRSGTLPRRDTGAGGTPADTTGTATPADVTRTDNRARRARRAWRLLAPIAAVLAAAALTAGCGSSGSATGAGVPASGDSSGGSGKPITIGIIADTTGATKTIGNQFIYGSEAAAKVFGPVDGHPVKFVVENGGNFSASATAANVIQLQSQDHVSAVLGMASSECEGAISVANRVQVPMIGNSCSIQDVVGSNCNYWFLNGGPAPEVSAKAMAQSARKQFPGLIGEKWVVVGDDPGWSQSVAQYWDAIPGAQHAGVEIAPFGTADWTPYIAKLQASGAKAVLVAVSWGTQYAAFLRQADAAGLFKKMQIVAPVGFPENSMVPGYGTAASTATLGAVLKTKVLSQYGGSWTYTDQSALGRKFVQTFYDSYHYPPPTQANVAMADTWMLLSAMKKVGADDSKKLMQELLTGSFQTPYWSQPLSVQADGRQINLPEFATRFEKLPARQYGVDYANKVLFVMPPSQVVGTAASFGCHPSS